MTLMKSDVLFEVHGGKRIFEQKVSLKPIEQHYEKKR